jgi:predicted nucleic acid-binding protein
MTAVFADTSFFVAILSDRDSLHSVAREAAAQEKEPRLTTEFVLLEVANFCVNERQRAVFATLIANLRRAADTEIVPASHELFERSLSLFLARPDKQWSLTDCTSFVVMQDRASTRALTSDRHFEQAGFVALLRQ